MKSKFTFISDLLFVALITFTLSLVLLSYFIPYPFTLVYSACVSALCSILYFSRSDKKNKAERLKKAEQKEVENLVSELNFCERAEQNDVLENALIKAGLTPERKRGYLLVKDKEAVIFSRFGFKKVDKADVVRAYNNVNKKQTAYILAQSFDADVISFAERFDGKVILTEGAKVYKFLKDNDALPEYKYKDFTERKKKGSLKNLLDKKKAKTFFVFGLVFLLTSYFSPLTVYYIVCGCVFLIYSLVLRLAGKDLKEQPQNA